MPPGSPVQEEILLYHPMQHFTDFRAQSYSLPPTGAAIPGTGALYLVGGGGGLGLGEGDLQASQLAMGLLGPVLVVLLPHV